MRFLYCFLVPLLAVLPSVVAKRPNVLFIAVDDLRPELGCYGASHVHSPNIDRFASTAVRFDRAYCQIAVCNPSRVSLLTGLRPDTSRVWDLVTRFRHTVPDVVTLPQHFKAHGYYAVSFGKIFHNPWPDNESWSEPHEWPKNARLWSDDAKQRLAEFRKRMKADGKSAAAIRRMRGPATEVVDLPDGEHTDGAIANQAIAALKRLADGDRPFFLAAGFVRPHLPFVVPRKYWELYQREEIPLAENDFLPRAAPGFSMNTMYELRDYMDYSATPDPREGFLTEAQRRELKHGYLASVSMIDAQIGRLLGELERRGLANNTIVVLWSDHGWKLGEHNSWCKQTNHEIDTRVPLLIRSPGAKANGRGTRSLAELLDLYPTLCELTGLPTPKHVEGVSLRSVLEDAGRQVKENTFSQFRRRDGGRELMGYAMRTDRFRYVEWLDLGNLKVVGSELYDHHRDPAENENVAQSNAETVAQLSRRLWAALPKPKPVKQERPRLTIRNESRQAVTVLWDRPDGEPRRVAEVPIGGSHVVNTILGHRFLIRGNATDFETTVTVRQREQVFTLRAGRGGLQKILAESLPGAGAFTRELSGHSSFTLRGWTLHLADSLWRDEPKLVAEMLKLLDVQLERVVAAVPEAALKELRSVPIWINPPSPGFRPGAEYHPDADWLKEHRRNPAMAKAVEITNTAIFAFEHQRMPYLMLHELAHGYHDRVLGFECPDIRKLYETARESGGYDAVKRFNGRQIVTDKAYAMSNHKEYFAENSEAYFGRNDFYPFDRKELQEHDPAMLELLEKLWKVKVE